ncbi:TPA: sigma-70 family RNA polymerase sigma factor [Bacillus cereus]|uniref:RNA polymerase sporulation specific sigma factor n=2 Tax=Wbetavirus TaxID=1623308 RepID=A0A7S6SPT9_9CAUD|nr:sigma-70 family RNA polymerase sigma factor [Bacillus cereus]YP_010739647.1 RNA polymerase sporulation specific sigma factor [Bacillus phage F16Ba]YP_010739876.1 RNA polymerase sporulation specific sigma factor [Bacillus phage Tavor_SA]HDR7334953.1 sigma-70 family RNA polymerase sigma factor [Bacillus anthracis]AJG59602.1 RNA polymerase sigma factor, sigma-70 family protein [Bacillus cereus D17]ARW58411.1 RNA polymerase sporulation specific sigma factor [Bacillus phage Tavor_SA]QKI10714.1 
MTKEKGQAKEIVDVRGMSDDEFMEKYERLVHHCVWKRYAKKKTSIEHDTNLDIEDLTQFGMIGLIKARDNFNPEFGCAFSTYAVPKIIGEIGRAIRDNQKVKVQRSVYSVKGKILNQQLSDKGPEEIADILNEPVTLVKMALKYQPSTDSLNKIVYASGSNEEVTLEKMLEDTKVEDIEETTINRAVIREFKAALAPKEYIVLDMHLQNMTQQNIANQMGYSQVQISRILAKINQRAAQFGEEGGLQD